MITTIKWLIYSSKIIVSNINLLIFFILAISKEEADDAANRGQLPYNGYSEEFLDRLEPNGNIPADKDRRYGKCKIYTCYKNNHVIII